jgi:hypothetical protein
MARIDERYFDIVTSASDFVWLCTVLLALSAKEKGGKPNR